jgi:hypothetical protein
MILNGFLGVFCYVELVQTEFQSFSFSKNDLEWNSEVCSLPRNCSKQNSEGFSLPRNGSERNSEVFIYHKTGGIPTELMSVPSCSVFIGIFFLLENGNPSQILHIIKFTR